MRAKRIVYDGLLLSLALVMYIVEGYLPPLFAFASGVKLGLGNIFIFLTIALCGSVDGLIVGGLKSLLGSIFSGNMFGLLYSFPATLASGLTMILLYKVCSGKFSLPAISVMSSTIFNLCQVCVACLILHSFAVTAYLPYIVAIGVLTGLFTGSVVFFTLKSLSRLKGSMRI